MVENYIYIDIYVYIHVHPKEATTITTTDSVVVGWLPSLFSKSDIDIYISIDRKIDR